MKNNNLDFKSLVIGILFTSLFFTTIGAKEKSDCDESEIISRVLYCIDGGTVDLDSGRFSTYCNR